MVIVVELYVNVFVTSCLQAYSAVSITLIGEQRFIRIIHDDGDHGDDDVMYGIIMTDT